MAFARNTMLSAVLLAFMAATGSVKGHGETTIMPSAAPGPVPVPMTVDPRGTDVCCPAGYTACGYECVEEALVELGLPCIDAPPDAPCDDDLPPTSCCGKGAVCCDGQCFENPTAELFEELSIDVDTLLCGDPTCCDLFGVDDMVETPVAPGPVAGVFAEPRALAPEPVVDPGFYGDDELDGVYGI